MTRVMSPFLSLEVTPMRLEITRDQRKSGMLGGGKVTFSVAGRALVSDDERQLIEHYKLLDEPLMTKEISGWLGNGTFTVKVKDLLSGEAFAARDLGAMIETEEALRDACASLKAYLEVARSFGGTEVVDL